MFTVWRTVFLFILKNKKNKKNTENRFEFFFYSEKHEKKK